MDTKSWWGLLNKNWDTLLLLIEDFHPGNRNEEVAARFPITAKGAEEACATLRREIGTLDAPRVASNARFNQDTATMLKILNETWLGMPESIEVHSIPGFRVLCDLCDDFPEEEENDS